MRKLLTHWRWLVPLLLYSADAHAWGLYTHVYFAQLLLWAVPLTDARYRRAIRSHPHLVLAGACLPDLALLGKYFGASRLDHTHRWDYPRTLLETAGNDSERALALGYVSHLLVDIIAHNHFVPAHETMWLDLPVATHAVSEWAMDHHVGPQLFERPARLLQKNRELLARYVARYFNCTPEVAGRVLRWLASAENSLRVSGIPRLCYTAVCGFDTGVRRRFNYYLGETTARLHHINRIVQGEQPQWLAEPCEQTVRQRMQEVTQRQLRHRMPLPQDLFVET